MHTWKERLIFLEYFNSMDGIYWVVMNQQEQILANWQQIEPMNFMQLWLEVVNNIEESKTPFFYAVGENIYMWIFALEENYYIFGPIGTNQVTPMQVYKFAHQYKMKEKEIPCSALSFHQLLEKAEFSYFGITGTKMVSKQKDEAKNFIEKMTREEKTKYDLYRFKEEKERNSYEAELNWYNNIKEGKCDRLRSESNDVDRVGILAKNNDYKQNEYLMVSIITLATRAAIEGGVPPRVACEMSDLLLQKLSQINHIIQIYEEFDINLIFSNLVCQCKEEKKEGAIVELCKDFIFKHLYKHFSIQQMADELAMNRTYLSRKFSTQMGMTLQEFIRRERLNAAANLLKYSEESVSQISEYMNFTTPSKFSTYFKAQFGVSPLQYRDKKKLIEFKNKK